MSAAIELMEMVRMMKETDKVSFEGVLKLWSCKWDSFLNERTLSKKRESLTIPIRDLEVLLEV